MMAVPGLVVGIQDMGAAGLTCSTCETASRGGAGIEIELDRVPQRESGMNSYEIMLSESQERMLVIVQRGREREIEEIFAKWDLHASNVGAVTDTGRMVVRQHGVPVADIPASVLTDQAPLYEREAREPPSLAVTRAWTPAARPARPGAAAAGRAAARCSRTRRSPPSAGSTASTITSSSTARRSCPAATPRSCGCAWASGKVHRDQQRLQRPVLRPQSPARGHDRDGRMPAQPGLHRSGPARDDRQPQFRQSLQAGELLPAARMRARPGRGLPLLRRAGRGRQRLPLQRIAGRGDRSDADRVRRRTDRGREAHHAAVRPGGGGEADPPRRAPRELGGSQYLGVLHGLKTGDAPRSIWRRKRACRNSSSARSGPAGCGRRTI